MDLAVDSGATKMFAKMAAGKTVNPSENRAALHTAARGFLDSGLKPDDPKILDDIQTVAQNIRIFQKTSTTAASPEPGEKHSLMP